MISRTHGLALSLLFGAASVVAAYAIIVTAHLGDAQTKPEVVSSRQIAARSHKLDAWEASLRKTLVAKPPPLPALNRYAAVISVRGPGAASLAAPMSPPRPAAQPATQPVSEKVARSAPTRPVATKKEARHPETGDSGEPAAATEPEHSTPEPARMPVAVVSSPEPAPEQHAATANTPPVVTPPPPAAPALSVEQQCHQLLRAAEGKSEAAQAGRRATVRGTQERRGEARLTNHLARLYSAAGAIVVFFLLWATIAAHPWATTEQITPQDPRLVALAHREKKLQRRAAEVKGSRRTVAGRSTSSESAAANDRTPSLFSATCRSSKRRRQRRFAPLRLRWPRRRRHGHTRQRRLLGEPATAASNAGLERCTGDQRLALRAADADQRAGCRSHRSRCPGSRCAGASGASQATRLSGGHGASACCAGCNTSSRRRTGTPTPANARTRPSRSAATRAGREPAAGDDDEGVGEEMSAAAYEDVTGRQTCRTFDAMGSTVELILDGEPAGAESALAYAERRDPSTRATAVTLPTRPRRCRCSTRPALWRRRPSSWR